MFKVVRISILLFVLIFVVLSTFLTQARSTDWNNSLWIKVYPITADGSSVTGAGRMQSCMDCHVEAPHGRLFGPPEGGYDGSWGRPSKGE